MLLVSSGLVVAQSPEDTLVTTVTPPAVSPARPVALGAFPRANLLSEHKAKPAVLHRARATVAERRLAAPAVVHAARLAPRAWSGRRAVWSSGVRLPGAERYQAGWREAQVAGQRAVVVTRPGTFAVAERRVFLRNQDVATLATLSPPARP